MTVARVLIIDDDPHLLSAMRRNLGERFDLDTAPSGQSGIDAARAAEAAQAPFAVVLCDMRMPDLDGIETLTAIRAVAPDTVPIMLTGNADQQTAIEAINRGNIFRFFSKPCEQSVLTEGIDDAIRQNRLLRAERLLAENEERWRLALQAVGDGVWDWAPETGRVVFSEGWGRMLGFDASRMPESLEGWLALSHVDDRGAFESACGRLLRGGSQAMHCEARFRCRNGAYKWLLIRGTVLDRGSSECRARRVIGTGTDISRHKAMEETLRRQSEALMLMATTDPLTDLWNRRCFLEKGDEEQHRIRRRWRPLSVVMLDVDFFKRVNDEFGHDAGDEVLRHLANLMKNTVRKTDIVGRLGGEEFAIMLIETALPQAMAVAEMLRQKIAVSTVTLPDGRSLNITVSMGVTDNASHEDKMARLLHNADAALYEAKRTGRNRVIAWSPPEEVPSDDIA